MAYRLYRPIKDEVPETGLGSIARNIVSSGAKAISDIANIPTLPEKILQSAQQSRNKALEHALQPGNEDYLYGSDPELVRKDLESFRSQPIKGIVSPIVEKGHQLVKSAFPDKYLEPHEGKSIAGFSEDTFQDYTSMLPLYLLSGGSIKLTDIGKFFGKVATGRYAGKQLKQAGFGTPGQIIGEIGVPALFEMINLKNIKKHFEPFKEDLYKKLPEVAGDARISVSQIEKALEESNKLAKGRINSEKIYENLNDIKELIKDGNLNVKDLQPLKVKLNTSVHKDKLDSLKPVLDEVNNQIKKIPSYGKAVHQADKLHMKLLNLEDHIEEAQNFIKDTIKTVPIKKASWIKKGASILVDNPLINTTQLSFSLARDFPIESGKYALKALKAALEKNSGALLSSLNKLGSMIEEVEDKEPVTFRLYRKISQ